MRSIIQDLGIFYIFDISGRISDISGRYQNCIGILTSDISDISGKLYRKYRKIYRKYRKCRKFPDPGYVCEAGGNKSSHYGMLNRWVGSSCLATIWWPYDIVMGEYLNQE